MSTIGPGDHVRCIDAAPIPRKIVGDPPVLGREYVVAEIFPGLGVDGVWRDGVTLEGNRVFDAEDGVEICFAPSRFEPIGRRSFDHLLQVDARTEELVSA